MRPGILNTIIIFFLQLSFTFAGANSPLSVDFTSDLEQNKKWIAVENVPAVRVDVVLDTEKVPLLLEGLRADGFTNDYDGYDDVYFAMDWTSATDAFIEYSRLIFGVGQSATEIRSWLESHGQDYGVLGFHTIAAGRMETIHQVESGEVENNPNPAKWYSLRRNGRYPITENYQNNYISSLSLLQPNPWAQNRMEVVLPLNSSDLNVFTSQIRNRFPEAKLIASHFGKENFRVASKATGGTAPEKVYKYPSARLVFDIDSIPDDQILNLLQVVEFYHSYKVAVARVYSCYSDCIQ